MTGLLLIVLGAGPAAAIAGFFLAHGILIVVEGRLRVRRWPRAARVAYVHSAFAVTAPLFAEAFLRSIGI